VTLGLMLSDECLGRRRTRQDNLRLSLGENHRGRSGCGATEGAATGVIDAITRRFYVRLPPLELIGPAMKEQRIEAGQARARGEEHSQEQSCLRPYTTSDHGYNIVGKAVKR
jgi:hypothetical protein